MEAETERVKEEMREKVNGGHRQQEKKHKGCALRAVHLDFPCHHQGMQLVGATLFVFLPVNR